MDVVTNGILSELVTTVLVPAVIALIGYFGKKIVAHIESKTEAVKTTAKNETIKTYIDLAKGIATDVVVALDQEIVNGLKKASADGKLTKEEANMIKNQAVERTMNLLTDDVKETLAMSITDISEFIATEIETSVVLKKEKLKKEKRL